MEQGRLHAAVSQYQAPTLDITCFFFAIGRMWDDIYPVRKDFEEDIEKHTLYLAYVEDNLVALYVISSECDQDYRNGQWKYDDQSAYVLHRFCVSPTENPFAQRLYLHNGYESRGKDMIASRPMFDESERLSACLSCA